MKALDLICALQARGVDPTAILEAVKAALVEDDNAIVRRRKTDAERQKRHRMSRDITLVTRDSRDTSPPDKEKSPRPPKEINPLTTHTQRAREDTPEFMEFWHVYPNKVGKPTARLKFQKALEKAVLADILAGLQRYIRDKPTDREWCNPATWLHQERWNDLPLYAVENRGRMNGHTHPLKPPTMSAKMVELLKKPLGEIYDRSRSEEPASPALRAIRNG